MTKERGPRLDLIKTTMLGLGSDGMNPTHYPASEQVGEMCKTLLGSLPNTHGLRIQIRPLNYLKDEHTKARYKTFVERQKEKKNEKMGNKVPEVNSGDKENKKEANRLDGGSSA